MISASDTHNFISKLKGTIGLIMQRVVEMALTETGISMVMYFL